MLLQSTTMVARKVLANYKITACLKQICLLCVTCEVSIRKTLSGETFCFLEKRLLSICKFCASSNLLFFFLQAADWPTTNFLGMYCYFPVIRLVNFVYVAPVTVVAL